MLCLGYTPGRAGGRGKLLQAVDAGTPTLTDLQFGETDPGGKTAQPPGRNTRWQIDGRGRVTHRCWIFRPSEVALQLILDGQRLSADPQPSRAGPFIAA
jgi:hypothetical protein